MITLLTSVLAASVVGSLHCVGMCGGLTALYAADGAGGAFGKARAHAAYHGARAVAYVSAGALGGAFGEAVDSLAVRVGLAQVAAALAGAVIIALAAATLVGRASSKTASAPIGNIMTRVLSRLAVALKRRPAATRAAWLGVSSALLPCGWLYAFVVVSAGTGSALGGASVMVAFWLGTLPALIGFGAVARAAARRIGSRMPLLMAAMLLAVGLATVVARARLPLSDLGTALPITPSGTLSVEAPCHGH